MRLFVALPVPATVTQQMHRLQTGLEDVRWQSLETMHLTLRFIGDVGDEQAGELKRKLAAITHSAFTLTPSGIGVFPNSKAPKVLWVGLEESPPLMHLQQKVEQQCRSAGLDPEERSYTPHLTLGRIKQATTAEVDRYMARFEDTTFGRFDVSEFTLFESRLASDGAVHIAVEAYTLQPTN